jgi:predicted ATPase/DNA-binding CsgD family transcriptional regulator
MYPAGDSCVVASAASPLLESLPIPRTRLIGRQSERATARTLLLGEAVPLLTLTGPGGVGKTRLVLTIAQDVADQFADGVVWVDLASLRDEDLVPVAVAGALGIIPGPNRPVLGDLAHHLRRQQTLLVLDNCEHLLAAVAALVAPLLASCPALQFLAASRAPLHVHGEQVVPIDPLPLPASTGSRREIVAENDAVRLFVERARAVRPSFALTAANAETIVALCRALDGLPLAIELAAARITILSPEALLAQMTDRLSLLSDGPRDVPIRQQTIAATIGWSYFLLSNDAQALFRRLAVFAGGFTLSATRGVAQTGEASFSTSMRGINTLVEQSLVHRIEGDGEPRFTMLETVRAFALERLRDSGEESCSRARHAAWFIDQVASREAWVAAFLPDGQAILDQLETEYANLHGALTWLRETGNVSGLLALAGDLVDLWQLRGHLREGRQWLEWGLAHGDDCVAPLRAGAQLALSILCRVQHESAMALELCEASLRHYRASGDSAHVARAASHAAAVSLDVGRPALSEAYLGEALAAFETLGDLPWAVRASSQLRTVPGVIAKNQGDVARAERCLREVVEAQREIARESGEEQPFACWPLMAWGAVAHLARDLPVALQRYQASLAHAWRFQEAQCSAYALTRVASILAMSGRWREAAWMLGSAEAFAEKIGLAFDQNIWSLTRAFGVPDPWQGPEDYTAQARDIRTAVLRRWPVALPPIADPDTAAGLWASGRGIPTEEAISYALAIGLDALPPPAPILAVLMAAGSREPGLTPRQHEILALLCHRLTDPEIAARLFLSPRTVEGHVTQILGKLGVANRREAAAAAARLGLI